MKAEVSGGKAPFKYQWNGGTQGETLGNLAAGEYALTLTDAKGASAVANFSVKEPKPLALTAKADAPASTGNADGKASAKASGGSGKYIYEWDNGETGDAAKNLQTLNHLVSS